MNKIHRFFLFGLMLLFSAHLQAQTVIESAFSPDDKAQELILKVIDSSQESLRLAAYSFTSPVIMKRLLAAKKRGVDIKIVVDEKGNRSKASKAAMNLMVNAGIPLRTVSSYRIHHDKYIVVDAKNVETGSFNYSQSAARNAAIMGPGTLMAGFPPMMAMPIGRPGTALTPWAKNVARSCSSSEL